MDMITDGSILIAEDDAALRGSLKSTLETLGFSVATVASGEEALLELRHAECEVLLLDLNMPGMGGLSACKRIRTLHPKLQIIVLTVRDAEDDKVLALDAGADDYITKPFHLLELTARIRTAIRRIRTIASSIPDELRVGELRMEVEQHRVFKGDMEIHLTPKEFELLQALMQHAGKPLSHQKLLTTVWGDEYGAEREYLRTYVSQLRRKIEEDPAAPVYLLTENYIGYRFRNAE